MYIVIAGGGIAGSSLASVLIERKHDVVIIEKDKERCKQLYADLGVVAVNGSATNITSLREAGIEKADVAIGALYLDNRNLTFAILAHSFGVPKIMVKMRVPEYLEAYKIAGVTTVCNMIDLFKTTILNELENPNVRIVTQLESSDALLAMIRYPATGDSDGITIAELSQKGVFAQNCVFAGIMKKRTDRIIMPRGSDKVYPGDKIFLVADRKRIAKISAYLSEIEAKLNQQQAPPELF
ncbi:MAG TPA: TrkA family potassium uptake protein [Deltaproteobacteria bacterium]|nr:TrkA family potassium uptake protein [Deltaproteobacteria bacterium]